MHNIYKLQRTFTAREKECVRLVSLDPEDPCNSFCNLYQHFCSGRVCRRLWFFCCNLGFVHAFTADIVCYFSHYSCLEKRVGWCFIFHSALFVLCCINNSKRTIFICFDYLRPITPHRSFIYFKLCV